VHEAYLEDIIYPQDVVAQKSVYEVGVQKPTIHIYLDPAERAVTEHKMAAFRAVYENLTGKKVVFDYLIYAQSSELLMQRELPDSSPIPHPISVTLSRIGRHTTPHAKDSERRT